MPTPPLPNVYLIGAERAGVRWLRFNLDQHPDICAPPVDLPYFARPEVMQVRGSRWYREQLDSWDGEPFMVAASPEYLAWRNEPWEVAARMHRAQPEARLIAIVRQPLDRVYSAARRAVVCGDLPVGYDLWAGIGSANLTDFELDMVRGGVYLPNLTPFGDLFGDRLQVLVYDDLVADPAEVYRRALDHIGASGDFVPAGVERVRFASPPTELADLTDEQRREIYPPFRENVEELGRWIGRDLSAWDPEPASA